MMDLVVFVQIIYLVVLVVVTIKTILPWVVLDYVSLELDLVQNENVVLHLVTMPKDTHVEKIKIVVILTDREILNKIVLVMHFLVVLDENLEDVAFATNDYDCDACANDDYVDYKKSIKSGI